MLNSAFLPEKKLNLPDGTPPFKSTGEITDQITKGAFWQIARKFDSMHHPNIKQVQRERMFINSLEAVSKKEADILIAVKDQTLDKLYSGLTFEALKRVGYF